MSEALSNGENIEIRGFGSFSVREYDSYTGRNPKTEEIKVKFKQHHDQRNYFAECTPGELDQYQKIDRQPLRSETR